MMNKTKILSISVLILVILNIIVISTLFTKPSEANHPPMHHKGPKHLIIEKLQLTKAQITAYEKLIKQHRSQIEEKEMGLKQAKNELYLLLQEKDDTNKHVILAQISSIQKEIELIHFSHFKDIKKLCTPDQVILYKELTQDLAKYFSPHRPPHRRP